MRQLIRGVQDDTRMRNLIIKSTFALLAFSTFSVAGTLYSTLPTPTPASTFSFNYELNSTAEFGSLIQFAGTGVNLSSATVGFANYSFQSNHPGEGTATGYYVPITLNLYNVDPGNEVGSLIQGYLTTALIPWRPEPSDSSPSYVVTAVKFNLGGLAVPDRVIYGVSFNTQDYGYEPTGAPGAYDGLNLALSALPPTIGRNPAASTIYEDCIDCEVHKLTLYTDWTDENGNPLPSGAVQFDGSNVPEPSTFLLLGGALLALAFWRKTAC